MWPAVVALNLLKNKLGRAGFLNAAALFIDLHPER